MSFISELLKIRCGGNEDRVCAITDYAAELCANKRTYV